MNDHPGRLSIGELAARSGVSVRTLRYWSDEGLIPPAERSDAGYRLYDAAAAARVQLLRTLRELDVPLPTARRVLERESTIGDVAAAHAAAVGAQISALRLRRAVLLLMADRTPTAEEMTLMHDLATMSERERRAIVEDFLDDTFAGLDIDPGFAARMRAALPALPENPSPGQLEAWIELGELVQDRDFRARIRAMAEAHDAARAAGDDPATGIDASAAAVVAREGRAALEAGVAPASPEAAPYRDRILAALRGDDGDRHALAARLRTGTDARAERYWQLLARINGWPEVPTTVPAWEWAIAALEA